MQHSLSIQKTGRGSGQTDVPHYSLQQRAMTGKRTRISKKRYVCAKVPTFGSNRSTLVALTYVLILMGLIDDHQNVGGKKKKKGFEEIDFS